MTKLDKFKRSSSLVFGVIGFFMGRAVFFGEINPFVVAYVTAFFCRREFYAVSIFSLLGLFTLFGQLHIFRYVFAIFLMIIFNYCADRDSMTKLKTASISALSLFTGGVIFTFFSNMAMFYLGLTVIESAITAVLYVLISDNIGALNFFDLDVEQSEGYSKQIQLIVSQKLKKAADIFKDISHTYKGSMMVEEVEEDKTRVNLIENICDNVCKNCSLNTYCWEKNRENTYEKMYAMTDKWLKNGYVNTNVEFNKECLRAGEVFMLVKGGVEKYSLNKLWLNKTEESKNLIGRQLDIMSDILGNLQSEVSDSFHIDKELSNKIYKELTGLSVNSVVAINTKRGYRVSINVPHYYSCNDCGEDLKEHLEEILGVEMIKEGSICRNKDNNCVLQFAQAPIMRVAPFVSGAKKDSSNISGDCYTYMELEDGRYLLALADGMGSGDMAREESAASIEMYEDFMQAGFDKNLALEIINSVLVSGNENEHFSTLDICTLDCYTGEAEFVKIGAVSTYIISEDKIQLIKSQSLPVGIVGNLDIGVTKVQLEKGDIIVMITDGILDSTGNVLRNEEWLSELIAENSNVSPEVMADIILESAKKNSRNVLRDDMTVMVAQIY